MGGQGTRIIKVRAPREEGISTVRAYLSIQGLPRGCESRASEVAGIAAQPIIDPYDRYGDVPLYVEKGRLQSAAAVLESNPGYRILIIKRVPRIDGTVLKRIQDVKQFLRETLGLSAKQFQIVTKTAAESSSAIWFVKPTTDIRSLINGN